MTGDLDDLRRAIDATDERIIEAVAERVRLAVAVAQRKARSGAPLLDPSREAEVVELAAKRAVAAGLDVDEVRALVRRLLALTRRAQLEAYDSIREGPPGSVAREEV
jgi:chorismate mutase